MKSFLSGVEQYNVLTMGKILERVLQNVWDTHEGITIITN